MLSAYANSNSSAQTYVYNGLGDRVRVEKPTGTRHFVYDSQGRVVAEYGASTNEVKAEFIWALPPTANDNSPFGGDDGIAGYAPLALVTTNAANDQELYWVHGNHLGVPLVTTNALGQVVDPGTDFLRPGFPGQSQVLSDLYYNRARDYDPVLGRYIQADPIGLLGDVNPYLYAGADPVNMIDQDGRRALPLNIGRQGQFALIGLAAVALAEVNRQNEIRRYCAPGLTNWTTPRVWPVGSGPILNANDAKAPGQPGPEDGYVPPKGGPRQGKAPNGKRGWVDSKGDVWVPTGPDGSPGAHGGAHWDVQGKRGGYRNVYPGGKVRK